MEIPKVSSPGAMSLDFPLALGGLGVGIVVGLTGMGGGALMTPMLVFFFGVEPLTAVSSDIVASLVMKPVGALVHARRGTVHRSLVLWLCVGSVPGAFAGSWLIGRVPAGDSVEVVVRSLLGVALLVATGGLVARAAVQLWRNRLPLGEGPARASRPDVVVRPLATAALGALAGLMVGLTSVGAGSIVIVVLLFLYPGLRASQLVGTDLAQAIPLVASAAFGHLLFGSFSLDVTTSLLLGAIPGAWIGAQISSRAPGGIVRRVLAVLLLASGLRLLGLANEWVLLAALAALVLGTLVWIAVRNRLTTPSRPESRPVRSVPPSPGPAASGSSRR
jgi:uncharacterized protein